MIIAWQLWLPWQPFIKNLNDISYESTEPILMTFHIYIFMYMLVVQNLAKKIIFRNSRWPPCPYMVKTVQTTSFPEPLCQLG